MATNCMSCGKEIGIFSTIKHEDEKLCVDCFKAITNSHKNHEKKAKEKVLCAQCGKETGMFNEIEVDGTTYCSACGKFERNEKNQYIPDLLEVRRALSALLTQDDDTKKLFEEGSRTYLKILGGDINNFINLNSNLIQSSVLLLILDKLESIDSKLDNTPNK